MTELRLRNKKGSGGEGRRFSDTETHTHIHFASWLTNTRQIQAPRVTKKTKCAPRCCCRRRCLFVFLVLADGFFRVFSFFLRFMVVVLFGTCPHLLGSPTPWFTQ